MDTSCHMHVPMQYCQTCTPALPCLCRRLDYTHFVCLPLANSNTIHAFQVRPTRCPAAPCRALQQRSLLRLRMCMPTSA